ncbi:DUF58 domain-containing protein [Actinotalea fermentans]|uniref:DUF58 domain-containing protein n=1 Tax=Actinotalea fermentans TaxID=43671 RepID=A0A511Z2B5_9CELL|nr:DUF58 domain-containing protein [Actinotalea fermentans]GEN81587.1 hypothetical protein AFE02nite_33210 [Actinotalea fermentans]
MPDAEGLPAQGWAGDDERPARPRLADAPRPPGAPWLPDAALVWTAGAGLLLLLLGALVGRADVALLGVAPAVTAAYAVWVRPRGEVWVDAVLGDAAEGERGNEQLDGEDGDRPGVAAAGGAVVDELCGRYRLLVPPGCTAVRLRAARVEHGSTEVLVAVPGRRVLEIAAPSVRTGPQPLFRIEHQGLGAAGLLVGEVGVEAAELVTVLPHGRGMPALPLPQRLRGLTGQHDSRRPGQGGGLRDVHPFTPGDSVRQVDWKVTARRSPGLTQLYVRRTMALGEAAVVLVLDSRDDVGPDPVTWGGIQSIRPDDATSLDIARQAAMSVAEGYLAVGDRVAVEDLGVRRRTLRPGTGRRHLDRVVQQLAMVAPEGEPSRRVRPPRLSSASLVYVFSTFLDPEAADMARAWRRSGTTVLAVDVLPRVRTGRLDARHWLAYRLVTLERQDRLDELAAAGVEVLHWADVAGTTQALQRAARRSHRRPGTLR